MPRPRSSKPAYCLHKSSGRAFVKLDGKYIYLGNHGSPESRDAYDRVVGEWIGRGRQSAPTVADDAPVSESITIQEIISAFWTLAEAYYRAADGSQSPHLVHFQLALKILNRLYGPTPAEKFGPLALKAG